MTLKANCPYYSDTLGIDDPDGVIRGIYIGSCVDERNAWSVWSSIIAHAHNRTDSPWFGWACFLSPEDVLTPSGRMTATLAHEVAHLLCPDHTHSAKWKRTITKMGFAGEIVKCGLTPL